MKLVDEGLKKIFEKADITDIIKAYGYLRNSGCYTRAESMSNALYNFDLESVNEYDLIIHREYRDDTKVLEFYKLADVPHLQDYIAFCLTHEDSDGCPAMEIHDDAYDKVIEFESPSLLDMMYLLKEFKGIQMRRAEERNQHQFVDGVVMEDGGEDVFDPEGDELPQEVVEEMQQWGEAAPDDADADAIPLPRNRTVFEGEDDTDGFANVIHMDELTGLIQERAQRNRDRRFEEGGTLEDVQQRTEELMTNINRLQQIMNNRGF